MKTGIVMGIENGVAIVLQSDGVFIKRNVCVDWQVGSVVGIDAPRRLQVVSFRKLAAIAACIAVMVVAGFSSHALFFETVSVISIDVNPSVELELNRIGLVVAAKGFNSDGNELLEGLDLRGMPYKRAIPELLQSDRMQLYLAKDNVLELSVFSQTDEQGLLSYVSEQGAAIVESHPQIQVYCNCVGSELVEEARQHGISPGKMRVLLELQQLDPDITIEEYSHHSMGEIHRLIQEHHTVRQDNGGGGSSSDDGEENLQETETGGSRHHRGNQNDGGHGASH